jgi:hypothetical protein
MVNQTESDIRNLLIKYFDLSEIGELRPSNDVQITIEKNGIVSVNGNVSIKNHIMMKRSPVRFGRVDGFFSVHNNTLISVVGFPSHVGDFCDMGDNQITSLDGAPNYVNGNFNCSNNRLISLVGGPEYVGDGFYASTNGLKNLIGSPKECEGPYEAKYNAITSLEGLPQGPFSDHISLQIDSTVPVLRLLLVDPTVALRLDSPELKHEISEMKRILNKFRGVMPRKKALLECQKELIDSGFVGNASW